MIRRKEQRYAYFAYGSNCNIDVLHNYLVRHNVDPKGIRNPRRVFLDGWQLRTNYLMGGMTGAANIEPAPGKHVEGVAMEITASVHQLVRRKEGWPCRYKETIVCVHPPRSRHIVVALTYVVAEEHRLTMDMPVAPAYRETILEAARYWGFARDYQKRLRKLLCTTTDCTERNEPRYVRHTR